MAESETYRLGTFFSEVERPSLEELASALDDEFIERDTEELADEGEELVFKDKGRNIRIQRDGGDYDYLHFRYVSDTKQSYRVRTEDDEEDDQSDTRLVDSRVLYFENGQFALETDNDLEDRWIPRFIGRATGYDIGGGDYRIYNLGEQYFSMVYQDLDIVTKLKLEEPQSQDEISNDVGDFVRNLAGQVTSFEFSSGGSENLKDKPAIDTCAEHLAISRMTGKYEEELMKNYTGSSVSQTLDYEDANPDNMEEQIRRESLAARDVVQEELERLREVYQ
ncbi:hypothetical protein [Haloarcula sp. JP-L23]|uniref:hypothetical protein n=1 Tax=Haloarcula sp. JP-L23 TaxID=2716717 RepID=UPI00140EBC5D|nr:hypothetical protein G9465_25175 [Haloarcula sp. JP-L23]